nr:relaxase/mobilization nuclease domain-containing protein [uncultured Brevundimonas sp.]
MVKITGRTRDGGHLQRHLEYISRNGKVPLEGPDGERLAGRSEILALAGDWRAELAVMRQRRDAPVSHSIILSMPAGTDPGRVEDAARAFASTLFADRHPYVFALHTDERHPHVHLTVRSLGREGERLNPRKADLQLWRETFAAALRDRGVEAEATPRRARGVVRKAERTPVRKLRERFERGLGPMPDTLRSALLEASRPLAADPLWETRSKQRQATIRRALVVEALRLQASKLGDDRRLGANLEDFIRSLPAVATRREILARALAPVRETPSPSKGRGG